MNRIKYFLILPLILSAAWSATVGPNEAAAAADLWTAMELNSGYLKIAESERQERLGRLPEHTIRYFTDKNTLTEAMPEIAQIRAYIIEYVSSGFVVIAADDRIEPVLVFSADKRFRWDQPERNFLRGFLTSTLSARWKNMGAAVDPDWTYLRSRMAEDRFRAVFEPRGRDIYILWNTALWNQMPYYNDTVAAHNGGNGGIPTGCVATAMAIKMKFHSYPPTGSGSHGYDDIWGYTQYSHSVNFANQSYVWSAMPNTNLTGPNAQVARLMYHAGVAVETDFEDTVYGGSGAPVQLVANAFNTYFGYKGTEWRDSSHTVPMMNSIVGRLPVVFGYILPGDFGHAVVACGYREPTVPYFYINCGWGGYNNGWYSLTDLPPDSGTIAESCPYSSPADWFYADSAWTGFEDGKIQTPFNTLSEGEAANPNQLFLKQGRYDGTGNVPITFTGTETIRAYWGLAKIGDKMSLGTTAAIKLTGSGRLKVY
jgi:hypothetical protein